ncbi:proton-associated sugar transporter A isoform X2 [Agrilus planipennis]|nr:proton-associated sugar transporter A isoform X2 [Agrilus planipennis]
MGIEFSYAAETAFVSPTLLKIGVKHEHMTLVWALSPLIGFFLTPILGSLSDRCQMRLGRRRPFILAMSLGVLLGLILVPNGENMGYAFGDKEFSSNFTLSSSAKVAVLVGGSSQNSTNIIIQNPYHPWGVFFTVLGTVLLDFDADACQSPARAYLLDVIVLDDHARGLSTFTVMAGLGGFMGYALGGINWDSTALGEYLGGHVKAVFTLITFLFIICVTCTITSFKEIPLFVLEKGEKLEFVDLSKPKSKHPKESDKFDVTAEANYGTTEELENSSPENPEDCDDEKGYQNMPMERSESFSTPPAEASLRIYLKSIIQMPSSLRILCVTNLFCWMAHVCYSLYFTDFVGEAVFGGNPTALKGTLLHEQYESGVRFGCWGMSMYSLSCACYSLVIEKLINILGAKKVYICGLLTYSTGMCLMALTKHKVGVILFSWTAGVMYSTLFTMPYLLVAHYHAKGVFEVTSEGEEKTGNQLRGLGTDIAIVSSMVFLAQFILSMCMGTIVSVSGTTTAVVAVASALAFFGAISATQVMYLDL